MDATPPRLCLGRTTLDATAADVRAWGWVGGYMLVPVHGGHMVVHVQGLLANEDMHGP